MTELASIAASIMASGASSYLVVRFWLPRCQRKAAEYRAETRRLYTVDMRMSRHD